MSYLRHPISLVLLLLVSISGLCYALQHRGYRYTEPDIDTMLQQKVSGGYLDRQIRQAIASERFDELEMYVGLSELTGVSLMSETRAEIAAHSGMLERSWRSVTSFADGFVTGESEGMAGLSGSIVSDMTLYGDLRDLKQEGGKYLEGESYDHFVLSLSMVGVALSASQLLTLGGTTGLKVGASMLKAAKSSGKLSKPFLKLIGQKLDRSVDLSVLKKLHPDALLHPKATAKILSKSVDSSYLKPLLDEVGAVRHETSIADTFALLRYVDTQKDLSRVAKLSKRYKGNTKGVMKVLGKSALRLVKSGIKWTGKLLWAAVTALVSLLLFLFGVWWKWRLYRKLKPKGRLQQTAQTG